MHAQSVGPFHTASPQTALQTLPWPSGSTAAPSWTTECLWWWANWELKRIRKYSTVMQGNWIGDLPGSLEPVRICGDVADQSLKTTFHSAFGNVCEHLLHHWVHRIVVEHVLFKKEIFESRKDEGPEYFFNTFTLRIWFWKKLAFGSALVPINNMKLKQEVPFQCI